MGNLILYFGNDLLSVIREFIIVRCLRSLSLSITDAVSHSNRMCNDNKHVNSLRSLNIDILVRSTLLYENNRHANSVECLYKAFLAFGYRVIVITTHNLTLTEATLKHIKSNSTFSTREERAILRLLSLTISIIHSDREKKPIHCLKLNKTNYCLGKSAAVSSAQLNHLLIWDRRIWDFFISQKRDTITTPATDATGDEGMGFLEAGNI